MKEDFDGKHQRQSAVLARLEPQALVDSLAKEAQEAEASADSIQVLDLRLREWKSHGTKTRLCVCGQCDSVSASMATHCEAGDRMLKLSHS